MSNADATPAQNGAKCAVSRGSTTGWWSAISQREPPRT